MIQCECCEHFHHLKCCGIPPNYIEIAGALLRLVGWTCRACRINKVSKQTSIENALKDLTAEVDKVKAASKAGSRGGEEGEAVGGVGMSDGGVQRGGVGGGGEGGRRWKRRAEHTTRSR